LAHWLTDWLGVPCDVDVAPRYTDVRQAVLDATHDVVWAPPLICGHVADHVRSILTAVRSGSTSSSAALIVRKHSDLHELSDLQGARAAWVDKLSMGGYWSAFALLRQQGYQPSTLFRDQGFCGSYRDAILAVAAGHADLTSVYARIDADDADIEDALEEMVGDPARLLRVLSRTPPAPYDALVVTRRMPEDAAASVEQALLSLRPRSLREGAVLLQVCQSEGFARLDRSAYAWLEHASPSLDREPSGQWAAAR
jgi:phosphonate transport system substrate-binding protein